MSRIKKGGAGFFLFMVMLCASMGIASAGSASAQPMPVVQEAAVIGGSPGCAFAAGLAVGLDVAGLFGCIPCAIGGAVVGVGTLIACT